MRPEELKYTADHLWVAVEGQTARIGISDYAQKQMEEVGRIESVKSLSDFPAAVNEDPLGAGWLARVRLEKPEELKALLSYDAYQKSLKE